MAAWDRLLGLDPEQLRLRLIRPTLEYLGLWSTAAENLVLGTGMVESRLQWVAQLRGPALGLFQMEPATERDHLVWLQYRPDLQAKVLVLRGEELHTVSPGARLLGNLHYQVAMCRIHYRRRPEALPDDPVDMAGLWKLAYNSPLGAGTVEKALPWFEWACTGAIPPAMTLPVSPR